MNKNLEIEVSELSEKGFQLVKFIGEFDKVGYAAVEEDLKDCVKNFKGKALVFDFAKMRFINSEGIGVLMDLNAKLVKDDKKLVVVGANAHVDDVFEAIGLKEVLDLYPKLKDFTN